jgi:hypothetical protein
MQALRRYKAASACPSNAATSVQRPLRAVAAKLSLKDKFPVDATSLVGDKLGAWMPSIYDALALPARAGAGALVSLPERLQTL